MYASLLRIYFALFGLLSLAFPFSFYFSFVPLSAFLCPCLAGCWPVWVMFADFLPPFILFSSIFIFLNSFYDLCPPSRWFCLGFVCLHIYSLFGLSMNIPNFCFCFVIFIVIVSLLLLYLCFYLNLSVAVGWYYLVSTNIQSLHFPLTFIFSSALHFLIQRKRQIRDEKLYIKVPPRHFCERRLASQKEFIKFCVRAVLIPRLLRSSKSYECWNTDSGYLLQRWPVKGMQQIKSRIICLDRIAVSVSRKPCAAWPRERGAGMQLVRLEENVTWKQR